MQGPMLKTQCDGTVLYTEQDTLPGGISREGSVCERSRPSGSSSSGGPCGAAMLTAAVREDWVRAPTDAGTQGPPSHPLQDEDEEPLQADIEDEYEGVCAANASSDEFSDVGDESAAAQDTEVVFVKEGVCVFPSASRRHRIMGRLSLIKQYKMLFLAWLPYSAGAAQLEGSSSSPSAAAAAGSGGGGGDARVESAKDRTMYAVHPIPLSDVRAIKKHTPPLGFHRVTITLANGVSLPSLYFQNGGVKSFLHCVREHAPLVRSADDPNTYLVNDTADPLQRSLCSLELTDALVGKPPAGASVAFPPFAAPLVGGQWQGADADLSLRAQLAELVDRFQQLTQSARDTASSIFSGSMMLGAAVTGLPLPTDQQHHHHQHAGAARPAPTAAAALANGSGSDTNPRCGPAAAAAAAADAGVAAAGEERRQGSQEASTSLGVFELIEGSPEAGGSPLWTRARPPPLGLAELNTFFDAEGRLTNLAAFKQRCVYGGVEPEARPEAWKLLLGLHAPGSTRVERQVAAAERRQGYQRLRQQWRSITPAQASRWAKWRERRTRVDKDVRRTDRAHRFYARERCQGQDMLRNLLLTYVMWNFDLGYVQGMSDLAAPILYVMRTAASGASSAGGAGGQLSNEEALGVEAEAFWCFVHLMEERHMEGNFSSDSRGMHAQLLALRSLVQLLDPPLYAHLEAHDCLNFFFCYRWCLIHFKREFAFDEVLRLWEALWAGAPGMHLYMCVAVLEHHRRRILSEDWDFDGMLKFCVELSGKLKLEPLLRDAELLASYAGDAGREIVVGVEGSGGSGGAGGSAAG